MPAPQEQVEYPALYTSTDKASVAAQRAHFRLVGAEVGLLIAAAFAGAFPADPGLVHMGSAAVSWQAIQTALVLAFLGVSILLRSVRHERRSEEQWFATRAIAESVKVESWRFMMKSPPYEATDAQAVFLQRVGDVIQSSRSVFGTIALADGGPQQIAQQMEAIRGRPVTDRAEYYASNRWEDQRAWYARRAKDHAKSKNRWFRTGVGLEAGAFLLAVASLAFNWNAINAVGFLTTAAAGALAWTQSRDHGRLANSYAMVAHELATLHREPSSITNDATLTDWVAKVEHTISREHTHWLSLRT